MDENIFHNVISQWFMLSGFCLAVFLFQHNIQNDCTDWEVVVFLEFGILMTSRMIQDTYLPKNCHYEEKTDAQIVLYYFEK